MVYFVESEEEIRTKLAEHTIRSKFKAQGANVNSTTIRDWPFSCSPFTCIKSNLKSHSIELYQLPCATRDFTGISIEHVKHSDSELPLITTGLGNALYRCAGENEVKTNRGVDSGVHFSHRCGTLFQTGT